MGSTVVSRVSRLERLLGRPGDPDWSKSALPPPTPEERLETVLALVEMGGRNLVARLLRREGATEEKVATADRWLASEGYPEDPEDAAP